MLSLIFGIITRATEQQTPCTVMPRRRKRICESELAARGNHNDDHAVARSLPNSLALPCSSPSTSTMT